ASGGTTAQYQGFGALIVHEATAHGHNHGHGVVLVVQEVGHGTLQRRNAHHSIDHAQHLGAGPDVFGGGAGRGDAAELAGQGGGHVQGGFGRSNHRNVD